VVLTACTVPHTIAYMKDTAVTIRLPSATRQRLETLARAEGRSLSAQVERLIEYGLMARETTPEPYGARTPRSLAGALAGGLVPELADFREVRSLMSASLSRRSRARPRR